MLYSYFLKKNLIVLTPGIETAKVMQSNLINETVHRLD